MKTKWTGLIILVLIIGGALGYRYFSGKPERIEIKGYVGGEKMALLENPEVRSILEKRYGVAVDYTKAGSIEMVRELVDDSIDFLWPSSQVALELFKMTHRHRLVKDEVILNSPIVLYSWDLVTQALIDRGNIREEKSALFMPGFPEFIQDIMDGATWKDYGVEELYGRIRVISTDPSKSNSGNMFSGLIANILSGGVVDEAGIDTLLPRITDFFNRLGYMEHSSSDLFEQYLRTGVGAKPIIAGYESQIIEFSIQYRDLWPELKNRMRIIYPVPTVWSAHPLIILKERGKRLIEALKDPDIQRIAWETHGFRTGLMGIQNDPARLKVVGIPERITKVIPMPSPRVMEKIIKAIRGPNGGNQ